MTRKKIEDIADVVNWQLCCGCGACAAVCPELIDMVDTLDYGRRPKLRKDIHVGSTEDAMAVCPGIALSRLSMPRNQMGGGSFYRDWGPVLGIWEGYASDPEIRFEGSSGGVATALALFAMKNERMSGALHIAAKDDIPFLNETVFSSDRGQLLARAGSRYAPASPCEGLGKLENASDPCVFIGKPCDAAALHMAAMIKPWLKEMIGLKIAFFCAGTPSTHGTLEMLRQMGISNVSSVTDLRYRGCGWPGMATVTYKDRDGITQQRQLTYEESWGEILQKYRQWRCYICPDHIGEFADIAVADAWHRPVSEHQPGRSIVIARSEYGLEMIHKAQKEGSLCLEATEPRILEQCMPWQIPLKAQLWGRLNTLKVMGVPVPDYQGFELYNLWRNKLKIKEKNKSFLGTIKRVFAKKLYKPIVLKPYTFEDTSS